MKYALMFGLHILLFAAAPMVFLLGLGIGLAINPTAGMVLLLLSGAIVFGNFIWLIITVQTMHQ